MVDDLASRYDLDLLTRRLLRHRRRAGGARRRANLLFCAPAGTVRELQQVVKAYAENGVRLSGIVFDHVQPRKGGVGSYLTPTSTSTTTSTRTSRRRTRRAAGDRRVLIPSTICTTKRSPSFVPGGSTTWP